MPDIPLPLVLIFLAIAGLAIWADRLGKAQRRKWLLLPTLEQYLQLNPECKTGTGIRCRVCGGGSLRNWGLDNAEDTDRTFICNGCGEKLYRRED